MAMISAPSLVRKGEVGDAPPAIEELRSTAESAFRDAIEVVEAGGNRERDISFRDFEQELRLSLFAVGRALVVLFLAIREQRVMARHRRESGRFEWFGRVFRPAPPIARNLATLFGVVCYWRTYMREMADRARHGFHPLDLALGLGADRFSWNVFAQAARLATQMSYAATRSVLSDFMPNAPSTEVLEKTMLGFGAHAETWFEQQPAPEDDGEVLVIEIDGKAVPTATDRELRRRRRKQDRRPKSGSPRHRGRDKRAHHAKQPRRTKGDKTKNGKVATMVVMYTLRRRGTRRLEGPVNRRHYASFGPKRHAFTIARREADKRGFTRDSGRLVQLVTDGDLDYANLAAEYLPKALHTIDCYHVFEKLWETGGGFLAEGSPELKAWVEAQKQRLFHDDVESVLNEMARQLDLIPKTGPGTKGRRDRLCKARSYIQRRALNIRYGWLRRRDLAISTGIVEGAVKNLIGRRCDHGGMRWIRERAQAVLQLRCIEANGNWTGFEQFVHDRLRAAARLNCAPERLQTSIPQQLPVAA